MLNSLCIQYKRITLILLSVLVISFFSIKTIVSNPDITANTILNYPSQHNGTKDVKNKACYYCHSLNNSHWNNDDEDQEDKDNDDEIYDKEDRDEEGREYAGEQNDNDDDKI